MTENAGNILGSLRKRVMTPVNRLLNAIDPPVVVLLYHRVASLACDPEMLSVTPENFRAQMRYLKENFPLVRFEDDWKAAPKPAIAVTFDDGYADNWLEALPILEEVGVPATIFITTGVIGTGRVFWWHELEQMLLARQDLPATFTLNDDRHAGTWPTDTGREREELYHAMVRLMNNTDATNRDNWLSQLHRWAGGEAAASGIHRVMTVAEARRLAHSSLVTVGAHTVTHTRLSTLCGDAQRDEITASKQQLEEWLGCEIAVFSYPFGRRRDYTRKSCAICREAGFIKAAANFPGQAHRWTDPYQIPRHLVRDWPVEQFAERLRGFWTR